ncbi:hypothetical protein [Chishuiella sp.]|uniref:hypothetical protein n=1 Tax=Chishuiella sp. TaxID=1969467 RepID=UPI0028AC5488|nr:hypothetical protein [Chishuiella sp.]
MNNNSNNTELKENISSINSDNLEKNNIFPMKNKKKTIIVSIVIILFISIGGILYLINSQKNNNDQYEYDKDESYPVYIHENGKSYTIDQMLYNKFFTIDEYKNLPPNYQYSILNYLGNNYRDEDNYYFVSRIPSRAKTIYCYGNFTNKNKNSQKDLAFIAEFSDYKSSKLIITNTNGDLLFTKEYYSLPIINSFKKGAKIYMGAKKLVPSNCDGIILQEPDEKYAIVFDNKTKQFIQYHQYTSEEIEEQDHYYDNDEEYENNNDSIDLENLEKFN